MLLLLTLLACASGPTDAELHALAVTTRRHIDEAAALAVAGNDINANAAVLAAARGEAPPLAERPKVSPEEAQAQARAIWCPKLEEAAGMPCAEALARYAP